MEEIANLRLAKKLETAAYIITVVVLILVGLMRRVKIPLPDGWDFSFLAPLHAGLNGMTALVLLIGFYFIKQRKIELHQKAMFTALVFSAMFLLSYVAYHFTTPETIFGDTSGDGVLSAEELAAAGSSRTVYLVLLLSHIVLAALIFPFILFTFIRAYTKQFESHRKMAKWVFPIWFYVALTGPIVYLMLMPYYQ